MTIEVVDKNKNCIKVGPIKGFSLIKTLECGQCFRTQKTSRGTYIIIAYKRVIEVWQMADYLYIKNTKVKDVTQIWIHYFDLERDYNNIYCKIGQMENMKEVIEYSYGIRILNQDINEVLTAFILSCRNTIQSVSNMIDRLCQKYGNKILYDNKTFYGFPDLNILSSLNHEDFVEMRFGYRAKYFKDIYSNLIYHSGKYDRTYFLSLKGIGNKIADCILLHTGLDRSVFPVDVWISRILKEKFQCMSNKYAEQSNFGKKIFGEYSGYAEIMLFYYARTKKVGKR